MGEKDKEFRYLVKIWWGHDRCFFLLL